jgi:hypothetical protein
MSDYFTPRKLCTELVNLVLYSTALVCFPDDGPLRIETGRNIKCDIIIYVLPMIGGTAQNLGPVVEMNTVRLFCTECGRNLKSSRIQCELCELWYHYSCGSVKVQAVERVISNR